MAVDAMTQAALAITLQRKAQRPGVDGLVADALDELDKRVVEGIMAKLEKNQGLLPQEAIMAWQQLFANKQLRRHLEREQRVGIAAAVAAKPMMDGKQED